jgi:hypothetical protein
VKTKNETNRHHNACCEKKENKKKSIQSRSQCFTISTPGFVHVDAHVRLVDTNPTLPPV